MLPRLHSISCSLQLQLQYQALITSLSSSVYTCAVHANIILLLSWRTDWLLTLTPRAKHPLRFSLTVTPADIFSSQTRRCLKMASITTAPSRVLLRVKWPGHYVFFVTSWLEVDDTASCTTLEAFTRSCTFNMHLNVLHTLHYLLFGKSRHREQISHFGQKKNRTLKLAYRTKISLLKHNPPVPAPFSTLNMRRVEKCGRQQCAKDSFRTKCIKSSDPQSLWKNVRWVETAEGIERRRKKKEERKERRDLCLLS